MKKYFTLKNTLIFLLVFPVWAASFVGLYEDRQRIQNKLKSFLPQVVTEAITITTDDHRYWAEEIIKGGYILHFRHAERDKWIDVHMYDALESEVHENGYNEGMQNLIILKMLYV